MQVKEREHLKAHGLSSSSTLLGDFAMATRKRNPLLPWFIGLPIVLAAVVYVGYRFAATDCAVPGISIFLVLGVVPVIYLALMYMTLSSQD